MIRFLVGFSLTLAATDAADIPTMLAGAAAGLALMAWAVRSFDRGRG